MTGLRHQQGVALIIVLMVVALVSVLATEMGARLQLQVKRATNIKDNNQAYWYAMGAEQFAGKSIMQLLNDNPEVVSLERAWNEEFTYPLEGGGIQAQLQDMQACFNLNGLREQNARQGQSSTSKQDEIDAFHRLLSTPELNIPSYNADLLRDSLADWLDSDDNIRNYGAEDSDYESLQFPYVAANNLMASKSELRLINGVDMAWLTELLPYVCVVPGDDVLKINVNTLTSEQAPLLAALTGADVSVAQNLINSRPDDGYSQVQAFLQSPELAALQLSQAQQDWFAVKTQYFLLTTKTKYNDATFAMSSLFKVDPDNKVSVIRREFGGGF